MLFLDLTLPFNLTGQPAISVPCGFTRSGLPIGLQLVGRPYDEATLFRAGAAYEVRHALAFPQAADRCRQDMSPFFFVTRRSVPLLRSPR